MQIKINENESYNIDLPSEIASEDFFGLLIRLNKIGKVIEREKVFGVPKTTENIPIKPSSPSAVYVRSTPEKKAFMKDLRNNREKAVEFVRDFNLNRKQFDEGVAHLNLNSKTKGHMVWTIMQHHQISPQEIGMRRWRRAGENFSGRELLIKPDNATNND